MFSREVTTPPLSAGTVLIVILLVLAIALSFFIAYNPELVVAAFLAIATIAFIFSDYRRGVLLAIIFSPLLSTAIVRASLLSNLNVTITQLLILVTALAWLASITVKGNVHQHSPIDLPLAVALLTLLATSLFSYPGLPRTSEIITATGLNSPELRSFSHLGFLALMCGFYFLTVQYGSTLKRLNHLLVAYFSSSTLAALYGIYQFAGASLGLPFTDINQLRDEEAYIGTFKRIDGTFPEPSIFSIFLMVSLVLLVSLLPQKRLLPTFKYPAIFIHAAAIFLTFSRIGWLTLAAALLFLVLLTFKKTGAVRQLTRIVLIALVASLAIMLVLSLFPEEVTQNNLASAIERLTNLTADDEIHRYGYYQAALNMFKGNPLTGIGFENYTFHYEAERPSWAPYFPYISDSHNLFLQIPAEAGIPGIVAFGWVAVIIVLTMTNTLKNAQGPIHLLAAGCAAALFGLAIAFLNMQNVYLPFAWFTLALAMICHNLSRDSRQRHGPGLRDAQ